MQTYIQAKYPYTKRVLPVTLAAQEVEAVGSQIQGQPGLHTQCFQDQPWQLSSTLPQKVECKSVCGTSLESRHLGGKIGRFLQVGGQPIRHSKSKEKLQRKGHHAGDPRFSFLHYKNKQPQQMEGGIALKGSSCLVPPKGFSKMQSLKETLELQCE